MQLAGQESWQVAHGSTLPSDMGLYVRDALALPVDTSPAVPSLDPPVPTTALDGVDRDVVAREWSGWWTDILRWCRTDSGGEDPRERLRSLPVADTSPALAARPALRAVVGALTEPAARYWSANRRPMVLPSMFVNEVVRDLERELGRPVKPFHLVITEVRVRGDLWEPLTRTHVLASQQFVNSDAVRSALREVLRPLA